LPVSKDDLLEEMVSHPTYGAVPPTPTYSNVTVTSTGIGTAGSGLTYTAGTGYNPVEATWSAATSTGTMHAKDLVLDGISLKQLLEERLNMMVPNPELEKEWAELKRLGDAYRELEADLEEKARIWRALKKV
jgi:hypothetical protein